LKEESVISHIQAIVRLMPRALELFHKRKGIVPRPTLTKEIEEIQHVLDKLDQSKHPETTA
jgi:hypothetical protein